MFWPSQRFWHFTSAAQIVKIQEKIGNSWIFDIISNFYVKLNFCFWCHQVRQSRQYKYLLRFSWVCFENKPKHIAPLHWHWKDKQTNRIGTSQFHEFFLKNFFSKVKHGGIIWRSNGFGCDNLRGHFGNVSIWI